MKNRRQGRRDKKEIKVTYISSPVKVKTSASNFRALVQELTGQESNVADMSMPLEEAIYVGGAADDHYKSTTIHNKGSITQQQWRVLDVAQGYVPDEATLMKPDHYSEFLSRSLMNPLNEHLHQYELF